MEETLGPIDVLVNNAGVAVQSPSLKQTKREWEKVHIRAAGGRSGILGVENSRFLVFWTKQRLLHQRSLLRQPGILALRSDPNT